MIHLHSMWALMLLVPLALGARQMLRKPRKRRGILFAPHERLPSATRTVRTTLAHAIAPLWIAGLLLLVASATRPQSRWSRRHRDVDAVAIMMVLDVSGSMDALDMSPKPLRADTLRSRLDAVKEAFSDFVGRRPDDLTGLISFGGYATTRTPLTLDHDALLHTLAGIDIPRGERDEHGAVRDPEEQMTAIGDALATACARLRESEAESRVVILLSDGDSNAGILEPEQAAKIAAQLGIRVYTIGVGSDEPAPFRTRDVFGRDTLEYFRIGMDEAQLVRIAEHTGGQYHHVTDPEGLDRALEAIGELETTRVEESVYTYSDERFLPATVAGSLLVAAASLLSISLLGRVA